MFCYWGGGGGEDFTEIMIPRNAGVITAVSGGRVCGLNKGKMFLPLCQANYLASYLNFDSRKTQKYLVILTTTLPSVLFVQTCFKSDTAQLYYGCE